MSKLSVVVLCVAAVCCTRCFWVHGNTVGGEEKYDISDIGASDQNYLAVEYHKLNDLLVASVKSNAPEANFKFAHEKFNLAQQEGKSIDSYEMKALRLFLSLSTITDQNKCSTKAVEIIYMNNWATRNEAMAGYKKWRIEIIIHNITEKHVIDCQQEYVNKFRSQLGSMYYELVWLVNDLTNGPREEPFEKYLDVRSSKGIQNKIVDLDIRTEFLIKILDSKYLFEKMAKHANPGLNKDEFKVLFDKYLVSPCKYYVQQLGPEIFELANIDAELLPARFSRANKDFYEAWARYQICTALNKVFDPNPTLNRLFNTKNALDRVFEYAAQNRLLEMP